MDQAMKRICAVCDLEFDLYPGKPGLSTQCRWCGEDHERDVGVVIYRAEQSEDESGSDFTITNSPATLAYLDGTPRSRGLEREIIAEAKKEDKYNKLPI
jgi:hypothetical protein